MKNAKKALGALVLTNLMLSLTSCDVHFGSKHYAVPWYVIAVIDAIVIAAVLIIVGVIISRGRYRCPECGEEFSPKWYQAMFSLHDGNSRVFKCPKCGRKGFCTKAE